MEDIVDAAAVVIAAGFAGVCLARVAAVWYIDVYLGRDALEAELEEVVVVPADDGDASTPTTVWRPIVHPAGEVMVGMEIK